LGEDINDFIFVERFIPHWIWGSITLRLLTIVFFYSAYLLLIGHISKLSKKMLIFCAFFLSVDVFTSLFSKSPFGYLFFPNIAWNWVALLWASAVVLIIFTLRKDSKIKKKLWVFLGIIPAIGLSFIRPVYAPDWTNSHSDDLSLSYNVADSLAQEAKIFLSDDEPIVLAFFTTGCPYCKLSSSRFGVAKRKQLLPKTLFIFPNTNEEIAIFLSKTENIYAKYLSIPSDEFLQLSGFTFPSVFLVEKDKSTHWVGGQVNNFAMQKMYKSKVK
jgi:thiol-disulfide isomerase/thioredoxin